MPIVTGDISYQLSGGAANSDPDASLGGIISSVAFVDAVDNNMFDDVSGAESAAGDVEYRCLYLKNNHATLTLQNAEFFISAETPSADSIVDVGVDPAGVGDGSTTGVAATPADEDTAPAAVSFAHHLTGNRLSLGNIPPGDCIAIWFRRTISAAAAAVAGDGFTFDYSGETAA